MSKIEPKEAVEPKIEIKPPVETKSPEPIKIMGDPKAPEPREEVVTLKSFTELKSAFEGLEKKINEFIPKPPDQSAPPAPKAYRLFDEFEVI